MTTKRTAAARRTMKPFAFAAAGLTLALALGGCESGAGLLGASSQPSIAVNDPAPAAKTSLVSIAPILGVPEGTSKDIVTQVGNGLDKNRFTVATSTTTPADYTLRGYATAAKDKAGTSGKLSYFFDVIDKSGKKINRIAGEEVLAAAPAGKDIWQSVTPAIAQSVATKTVASFSTSIASTAAIASAAPSAGQSAAPASPATPVLAAATPSDIATASKPASAQTTTGSIGKSTIAAVVPSVTGAPGDGSSTLAAALQKELSKNGVAMADASTPQAYRVEGKVAVGADKDGKQPIQIDWVVKDAAGKKLGTVSQKNEIPQGSLDGAWGKTADAAAAAAAQGILKLIPGAKTQ